MPPTPKIPLPPTELTAQQVGERVLLRWTLPRLHTDGTRLAARPQLEIHRAFLPELTGLEAGFASQARVAYLLPEPVLDSFRHDELVVFPDVLGAGALAQQAGRYAVYGVKAVNARGQDAGFSSLVAVRVYPVAAPLAQVESRVTESAIVLGWEPPQRTTSGTRLEAIAGYQVYRSHTGAEGSFALRGTTATARYEDVEFQFGARYFYRIRTLAQFGADTVESDNSVTVEVAPSDTFPPPAPAGLIAVAGPARIDLTWEASPAADLAGYNVYRRAESVPGFERLTAAPLQAQSFADTGLAPGARYTYAVTAVDLSGNESPHSNQAEAAPLPPEEGR